MLLVHQQTGNGEVTLPSTHFVASPMEKIYVLVAAVAKVESAGDPTAFNKKENAAGILQIRPIMLREINRLCGTAFKLLDRFDEQKSIQMFVLLQQKINPSFDFEYGARVWNGGYGAMDKESTAKYWHKVKKHLKK